MALRRHPSLPPLAAPLPRFRHLGARRRLGTTDAAAAVAAIGDAVDRGINFKGQPYGRNLRIVEDLERFAPVEVDATVSQLAVAWALATRAVHVAIVGTRSQRHIEEAIRAADLALDAQAMRRIDEIVRDEVPVGGPRPSPYEEVSAMDGTSTTSVAPRAAVPAKRRHDGR